MPEDFRVEVDLNDEAHGYSLRERLRALDLDDHARERLGKNVVVTRDGSRLFVYAATEEQVREAERVVRELVDEDELTADIAVTRWHPVLEDWQDASVPLPTTADEEQSEYEVREAAETVEASQQGEFDWHVVVESPTRGDAANLAKRLSQEGHHVSRRWRYLVVGAVTEEQAEELAERLRAELGASAEVWIEADLSDVRVGAFQFIGF